MVYVTPPTVPVSPTSASVHTTVTPFAARRENGAATVTDAVALADRLFAVIVAGPLATAVTSPADDTVATDAADVAHVTDGLGITSLFASVTVAVSWVVSSSEANVSVDSDNDRPATA